MPNISVSASDQPRTEMYPMELAVSGRRRITDRGWGSPRIVLPYLVYPKGPGHCLSSVRRATCSATWTVGRPAPMMAIQGIVVQVYGETATRQPLRRSCRKRSSVEGTNKLFMVLHKGHETISGSYPGMVRQESCWHETEMAWKDDARC